MDLTLERIAHRVGATPFLYPLELALVPRAVTVLLGATQAGKTTLMRIMAGLDKPSGGRVLADGVDVTGMPVRERNVAMVYQQFINYPSMTVAQNIASPLRLQGRLDRAAIAARVNELASRLHIDPFLNRLPAELSGGQQQRVALARALAKRAPLMLLDEPLVNLDYKLREELRDELSTLFAAGESTVVYATTEPTEALLLGGYTAVMDAGELLQYGPTAQVFHRPCSIRVARAFSDPPMNLVPARAQRTAAGLQVSLPGEQSIAVPLQVLEAADTSRDAGGSAMPGKAVDASEDAGPSDVTIGIRASALRLQPNPDDLSIAGRVALAEISGSDTFVHAETTLGDLVAQLSGVHSFAIGAAISLYLGADRLHVFNAAGELMQAPRASARVGGQVSRAAGET